MSNTINQDLLLIQNSLPKNIPNNFCIAPFQSIRQNPNGRNSPCAFGAGEWRHGHLSPEERWYSTELNELRKDFISDLQPKACNRCWDEEAAGKKSLRQRQLEYFPKDYNDFILSGDWMSGPKTAVFKVSNVCNLACRSCGGWDSNTFAKEGEHYIQLYNTTVEYNNQIYNHNRFIPLMPPTHMDFSQYYKISKNLTKIDFFGGEPFLNISQLKLLEYLVENDLSKNITLYYSTNCTNHPTERLKTAWNKFKRVEIAMSIDGTEKEFEYLRWPGKWDTVLDVLNHIKSLDKQLDCEVYTMASVTLSIMNAFSTDKLLDWVCKNIGPFYINMVQNPEYLAVHIAPDYVKSAILKNVNNDELINYMNLKKHNPNLWKQFIIWMKRQDLYRSNNFSNVFPDYFDYFASDWNSITDLSENNFNKTF